MITTARDWLPRIAERQADLRPAPISACILAFQAENHIVDCIRSLSFCDEILVVDAHSTDRTRELAAQCGARVIEREGSGRRSQREFAIRAARYDWVLCLNADERLSNRLRDQIRCWQQCGFGNYSALRLPRTLNDFGQFLRHDTIYPDRPVQLFDRRPGGSQGDEQCLQTHARVTAEAMHASGLRASRPGAWLAPLWHFVRRYLLRGGFLHGWRGLSLACMESEYVRETYLRLILIEREP